MRASQTDFIMRLIKRLGALMAPLRAKVAGGSPAAADKVLIRRSLLAAPLILIVSGCGDPEPAMIHGQVYLAEDPTSEQSLIGLRVHLIPAVSQVDSSLMAICTGRKEILVSDTAARAEAWSRRNEILNRYAIKETRTDATSAYMLDSIAPGRYHIWGDTTVGGHRWTWLERIRLMPGDTLRLPLSNANPDENPFRCPTELGGTSSY